LAITPDDSEFPYIVITKKTEPSKSIDLILIRCLTSTCSQTQPLWLTNKQWVFGPSLAFYKGIIHYLLLLFIIIFFFFHHFILFYYFIYKSGSPYISYVTKESSDGQTFTNPALQLLHCTKPECDFFYPIQIEQYATEQVYFGMTKITFNSYLNNNNFPIIGMLLQDRVDIYYCHDT